MNAYHLTGGRIVLHEVQKEVATYKDQILMFYLENVKDLGDHLMVAFASSPSSHALFFKCEWSAHTIGFGGEFSSTFEVTTVEMEFWYLNYIIGDPKHKKTIMAMYEHFKGLPKT